MPLLFYVLALDQVLQSHPCPYGGRTTAGFKSGGSPAFPEQQMGGGDARAHLEDSGEGSGAEGARRR